MTVEVFISWAMFLIGSAGVFISIKKLGDMDPYTDIYTRLRWLGLASIFWAMSLRPFMIPYQHIADAMSCVGVLTYCAAEMHARSGAK
jgi:hypothetical protein